MAQTILTILAGAAIIAAVGLIAAIIMNVLSVQSLIATGKRAVKMVDKPKIAALKIADTGKTAAFKIRDHAVVIGGHVKAGAESAMKIKSDIESVSKAAKS
jgi:hypothetical protein